MKVLTLEQYEFLIENDFVDEQEFVIEALQEDELEVEHLAENLATAATVAATLIAARLAVIIGLYRLLTREKRKKKRIQEIIKDMPAGEKKQLEKAKLSDLSNKELKIKAKIAKEQEKIKGMKAEDPNDPRLKRAKEKLAKAREDYKNV